LTDDARALGSFDQLVSVGPLPELNADRDLVADARIRMAVTRVALGLVVGARVDDVEREVALVVSLGELPDGLDARVSGAAVGLRASSVERPAIGGSSAVAGDAHGPAGRAGERAAGQDQEAPPAEAVSSAVVRVGHARTLRPASCGRRRVYWSQAHHTTLWCRASARCPIAIEHRARAAS